MVRRELLMFKIHHENGSNGYHTDSTVKSYSGTVVTLEELYWKSGASYIEDFMQNGQQRDDVCTTRN